MRKRKWLIVLLVLAAVPLLLILFLLSALLYLDTDSGRDQLREIVVSSASDALNGEVAIEAFEGSLYSDLTIRGLLVKDAQGHPVARVGSFRLVYRLGALLENSVHVERIEINDPWVRTETDETGALNLAQLVPPSPEKEEKKEEPAEPLALTVRVDRFALSGGALEQGPHGSSAPLVDALAVELDLLLEAGTITLDLQTVSATVHQPQELSISANTKVALEGTKLDLAAVEAQVDGATLRTSPTTVDLEALTFNLPLALSVPPALVRKLAQDQSLNVALTVTATASHERVTDPFQVLLSGTVTDTPLTVDAALSPDFSSLQAELTLTNLHPKKLHSAAPEGRVSLSAAAQGPLTDLTATATITARDIRHDQLAIDSLAVRTTARHLPQAPAGTAQVSLQALTVEGTRMADVDLGAHFAVGSTITADLFALDLKTRLGDWHGERADVALYPNGRLAVKGFAITSTVGSIVADADIDTKAPLTNNGFASLVVKRLQLDAVTGLLLPRDPVQGLLDIDTQLRVSPGQRTLNARLSGSELGRGAMSPLTLAGDLQLDGTDLGLEVTIQGEQLGTITTKAQINTPQDPIDARAWSYRPERRLRSLASTIEGLQLDEVARIIGQENAFGGNVSATVEAQKQAKRITFAVEAKALRAQGLYLPAEVTLKGGTQEEETTAEINLQLCEEDRCAPIADVALTAQVGDRTLAKRGFLAFLDTDAQLNLQLADLDLQQLLRATTPPDQQRDFPTGQLTGRVEVTREKKAIVASVLLEANAVRALKNLAPINTTVTASMAAGQLHTTVTASSALFALDLAGEAQVPTDPTDADAWKKMGPDALQQVTGQIEGVQLERLAEAGLVPEEVAGIIATRFTVKDGLRDAKLSVSGRALQAKKTITPVDLDLTVTGIGKTITAELDTAMEQIPLAKLDAQLNRPILLLATKPSTLETAQIDGTLEIDAFPINTLMTDPETRKQFSGDLSLTTTVQGRALAPQVEATLALQGARIGDQPFSRCDLHAVFHDGALTSGLDLIQEGGGRMVLHAEIGKQKKQELAVALDAERFSLTFVKTIAEALDLPSSIEGALDAHIEAKGKIAEPQIAGNLQLSDTSITISPELPRLTETRANATFQDNRLTFATNGVAGGGTFQVNLEVQIPNFEEQQFEVRLKTEEVSVATGPTVAAVTLDVEVKGQRTTERIDVEVITHGGLIYLPGEMGSSLHPISKFDDLVFVDVRGQKEKEEAQKPKRTVVTKIHVHSSEPLLVRSEELEATIATDLVVETGAVGEKISGHTGVVSGRITLFEHEYEIARADVRFAGHTPPVPRLDVELIHTFEDEGVEFKVRVTGSAKEPRVRFLSNPPSYDERELLGFFLGGKPNAEEEIEGKALSAAAGLLAGPVQQQLKKSLPIDTIKLDLGEDGTVPSLTIGKWLTRDLFVSYTITVDTASSQGPTSEGLLRYRLSTAWSFELVVEPNKETGSAKATWVKRF